MTRAIPGPGIDANTGALGGAVDDVITEELPQLDDARGADGRARG